MMGCFHEGVCKVVRFSPYQSVYIKCLHRDHSIYFIVNKKKYAFLSSFLVTTQIVKKFGKMINPFGHADQAKAYAEAQQTSNVGNEIDDAKLVLFDDACVVGLLEEDLQHDQVITRITNQQLLVLGGYLGRTIEGITGYVANPF